MSLKTWIAAILAGGAAAGGGVMALSSGGSVDVIVGGTPTPAGTPTPTPTPSANIWIENGAGACAGGASSSADIDYAESASPDRRCGTIDAAWDAMSNGYTACISASGGAFSAQTVSGNKTAETTVKGCQGAVTITSTSATSCGYQEGALCANANFMTLEDVELDSQSDHGASIGSEINGSNVTWNNVSVRGLTPGVYVNGGADFHWNGGELGEDQGGSPVERSCANGDGQPFQFENNGGIIESVYFWPNGSSTADPTCGEDNSFHLESIRVQGAQDITIRNNYFAAGSEAGSGHIFWSGSVDTDQVMEGNYFGAQADGTTAAQNSNTVASCAFTWRYNTFEQPFSPTSPCSTNGTWTGNLGIAHCGGTHTSNVWIGSGSCTGDTFTGGTFAQLNLTADGRPTASSSAVISAGGSGCSSLGTDFDGNTRPLGGACEVGAFEYAG